jgi:hypothetical protein
MRDSDVAEIYGFVEEILDFIINVTYDAKKLLKKTTGLINA